MKRIYYCFLIILIISIAIKVSINQNSTENCIDFPNICSIEQTCVSSLNTTEFACTKIDQLLLTQKLVSTNEDNTGKFYQHEVSIKNNSKNKLKDIRISTD
ncbi:hypothetical protein DICPUDRAFT_81043, partial [Dictyostelium purpureum]